MSPPEPALPLRHALALGALQGPAELLPISSSGHIALVPWLLRWPYAELDPEARKSFEVALHVGTAAALALAPARHDAPAPPARRRLALLAASLLAPAAAGAALERPIERRLGTPATIAGGLVAGAGALAWAAGRSGRRRRADATAVDGLALGVGQALALAPGTSRSAMTLVAARACGFAPADAAALARDVALPVLAGAGALKGIRLAQRGLASELRAPFAAGAGAAFAATLVADRALARRGGLRSPVPFAAYRVALAALVLGRVRGRGRWQNGRR